MIHLKKPWWIREPYHVWLWREVRRLIRCRLPWWWRNTWYNRNTWLLRPLCLFGSHAWLTWGANVYTGQVTLRCRRCGCEHRYFDARWIGETPWDRMKTNTVENNQ